MAPWRNPARIFNQLARGGYYAIFFRINEKRYPGDYFTEVKLFKEAGFTNKEILACATRVGAEILDMADKLGTLEKGKLADVLVVAGNPLDDIFNLKKMRLVIADGRVVRDRLK